jgi:uncharacterized protein (TIRG00374 family)
MKSSHRRALFQWGLGILFLFFLLYFGDVSQLSRLPRIRWTYILMGFLCTLGFTLSHNFRWKEIVESVSGMRGPSFISLCRYLVNSYALGTVIPMDLSLLGLRSYYLNQFQKIPVSTAVFSVLLDRFLELVILLVAIFPSFLFMTRALSSDQTILTLLLFFAGLSWFALWKKGDTFNFLLRIYEAIVVRWLSKVPFLRRRLSQEKVEANVNCHFSQASVLRITGWSFIKYIFLSLRFYFIGQSLGVQFPLVESFLVLPLVQLSGLINVTPAGLGVVEMGTYGALLLMGIHQSQILIFVIGQRVLLSLMLLGLLVLIHLISYIQSGREGFKELRWKG